MILLFKLPNYWDYLAMNLPRLGPDDFMNPFRRICALLNSSESKTCHEVLLMGDIVDMSSNLDVSESDKSDYNFDSITSNGHNLNQEDDDDDEKHDYCNACDSINKLQHCSNTDTLACIDCGMVTERDIEENIYAERGYSMMNAGSITPYAFTESDNQITIVGIKDRRLQSMQSWGTGNAQEKKLEQVFKKIDEVCQQYRIPDPVSDDAKIFYKKIGECKQTRGPNIGKNVTTRGDNRIGIIAACLFKACTMHGIPHSVTEFSKMFELKPTKITRGNRLFTSFMNQNEDTAFSINCKSKVDPTEYFVERHMTTLKLGQVIIDSAKTMARNIKILKLTMGHTPITVGAGIIMIVRDYYELPITNKTIAALFPISNVTASKVHKKLCNYPDILIDDELTLELAYRTGIRTRIE